MYDEECGAVRYDEECGAVHVWCVLSRAHACGCVLGSVYLSHKCCEMMMMMMKCCEKKESRCPPLTTPLF